MYIGDAAFIMKSWMSCYYCIWWLTDSHAELADASVSLSPCLTETQPHDITEGAMVNIDFAVAVHSLAYDELATFYFSSAYDMWANIFFFWSLLWSMSAGSPMILSACFSCCLVYNIAVLCNGWRQSRASPHLLKDWQQMLVSQKSVDNTYIYK